MNYQSSRSHCIYTIRVVRVRDVNDLSQGRVNRLSFCDLAGSERAAKTQTSGVRLKEAGSINSSLLVLGRCLEQLRMNQMGKDKRMIPFRDSKLTRIFSGFFMGQGKAVMIANASPCDYTYDETFHVLKFSALARKIKVNDTFFSEASSTLQSICNEWSNTSNRSLCNDSMESLDTSDIIQKKDEIIEQLIQLAEKLTKKEQDMADMEIRIRQEVCREYSEYSDQLLEQKRIMYEEQIDAVRENYKKMLAKRDIMYEKIIEDYKQQLNEMVDSSEDTFNDNDSIVVLENSGRSSPGQSIKKNTVNLKEAYESQKSELKELQSNLESVNTELEKTKQELLESQKSVKNLGIELNTCKDEKERLSNECKHSQNAASTAKELTKRYEDDIKDLEGQLSYLRKELSATKELCQNKEFNFHEMKSETEVLKNKSDILEKEVNELKDAIQRYDADAKDYETKIGVLKDNLLSSENNYTLVKEQLQLKLSSSSEIEKENGELENKVDMLRKEVNELKDIIERYEADTKDYETKIGVLEEKLLHSEKNHALVEEQLRGKLSFDSEIEKENEVLKSKVDLLEKEVNELKDVIERDGANSKDYETKICALKEKLLCSERNHALVEEQLHVKLRFDSEIEKENEVLKCKVDMLEKEVKEMKDIIERYNADTKDYESKISVLEEKLLCSEKNHALVEEQLQVKLKSDSEIEKENVELKNGLKALKEQLKEIEKHDLDAKEYESKVFSLEEKLLSNENYFKEQLQAKLSTASQLEKENVDLKNGLKALKEQLKEVEKHDLDTKDYESKIFSLEEKLLSNENYYKEQLQSKLSTASQLEKELKGKIMKLEMDVGELNDINTKSKTIEEKYKTTVKFLEERLQYTQVALGTAEEQMKAYSAQISGLDKEIEKYKNEMTLLEKKSSEASERLKEVMDENDSKVQNFEQVISSLKNELSNANKELEKIVLHLEELLSEIEVDGYSGQDDSKVQRNYKEFSNRHSSYQSITEKLKEKISILQQELKVANKNTDLIRKEMKVRETVSVELEKEIDIYKQEIESLKQKLSEKVELEMQLLSVNRELESVEGIEDASKEPNKDTESLISEKIKLEKELSLVRKELDTTKDDIQKKISKLAELESRNSMFEQELLKLRKDQETKEIEYEQLSLAIKKLETVQKDFEHKSSELECLKLEMEKMKQKEESLISEKSNLQEKLVCAERELKVFKNDFQQKIQDEMEKMKQKEESLISEKLELQENLVLAKRELEDLKNHVQQKSSNEQKIQNEMEKMKQKEESLISEKADLLEKLVLTKRELEDLKNDVQQEYSDEQKFQNEINVYKEQIRRLKEDYENLQSENVKAEEDVQCYKEKLEASLLHVQKDDTASNLKLVALEKEILVCKHDIKKMKDSQKLNEEEKQDLMIVISANEEKIEDLEDKLTSVSEELLAAKDDILARTSATDDLENRVVQLYALIEILGKCEAKASRTIEMLQSAVKKHRSEVLDMHCQIRKKEFNIEELEKALCDCQEQLKNVQRSCDQKLVSEKEQHEIEIEQTIKLKHLVEEENMSLKKQKLNSSDKTKTNSKKENPSKKKSDGKKENPPKKKGEKGKENVPKSTPEKSEQRGRKRLSEEDFEPCPDRASKEMKPAEASKIPVTRTTRRKIQTDKNENLSPIQKITNSITSKVRVLSNNISSQISSPRLTRGRRRLFNPEASSLDKRATKGKKT